MGVTIELGDDNIGRMGLENFSDDIVFLKTTNKEWLMRTMFNKEI
jgi:hypothetical protein